MKKDEYHVVPENDKKRHVISISCKCHPTIEDDDEYSVLVQHHSYDGREGLERASSVLGIKHSDPKHRWSVELIKNNDIGNIDDIIKSWAKY